MESEIRLSSLVSHLIRWGGGWGQNAVSQSVVAGSKKRLRLFSSGHPVGPATCWERQRGVCQVWRCRQRWKGGTSCHNHIADRMEISYINALYFVLLCATPAGLCQLFWTCSGVQVGCLQEMAKKTARLWYLVVDQVLVTVQCTALATFLCPTFSTTGIGISSCILNFLHLRSWKFWQ